MFGGNPLQYTFVMGPARFVAINTEVFFLSEGGNPVRAHQQLRWLKDVLESANKEREQRPWLIILQHRPVYCTNAQFGRCPGGQTWVSFYKL